MIKQCPPRNRVSPTLDPFEMNPEADYGDLQGIDQSQADFKNGPQAVRDNSPALDPKRDKNKKASGSQPVSQALWLRGRRKLGRRLPPRH